MSKSKQIHKGADSALVRKSFEFYYKDKFFNKFLNKIKLEGLNYQQAYYCMKKWYYEGSVACSLHKGALTNLDAGAVNIGDLLKENKIVFTPWTSGGTYNPYDFVTTAIPINTRGVPFIQTVPLEVDKDIVIIYILKSHKSVYDSIQAKINEIIDIEMTMRTLQKRHKTPWAFKTTPENETAIKKLIEDLDNDEPYVTVTDINEADVLKLEVPYILDKLEMQRQKIEDDIDTMLACQNVGIAEKKEHLTVGEVEANNQPIQDSGDDFITNLQEGFDRVYECFTVKVTPKLAHEIVSSYNEDENNESEEDNENDD